MKIELKKLKVVERLSEETTCFVADLYIDGKHRGFCKNDGHGGDTMIHPNKPEDRKVIEECERYCKTLPKIKGFNKEWERRLEDVVDDLVHEEVIRKGREKDMKKGIVIKDQNGDERIVFWKKTPISKMLSTPEGKQRVKDTVTELKGKGYQILNTNLPNDVL